MVSEYPDLGCIPEGIGATECWIGPDGHGSDGHGPADTWSMFLCCVDTDEYWIGDLGAGIHIAMQDRYARVWANTTPGSATLGEPAKTFFMVVLSQEDISDMSKDNALGEADATGNGATLEEAWRYALAAVFGPADDLYDEHAVRRMVAEYIDPAPEPMTPNAVERWLAS